MRNGKIVSLVLDSSAVIALLKNEDGGEFVSERIEVFYEYSRAA